jgi:hypothetical protein
MPERETRANLLHDRNKYEPHVNWTQPGLFRHYSQVFCILGSIGGLGVAAYFVL